MRNRTNLFVMYATCVGLLAMSAVDGARLDAVYAGLPGGREGVPGFTRAVLGLLDWLKTWWPLCLLVGAMAAFGGPPVLRRTPAGDRFLLGASRWLTEHHGTVVVVFVAGMFTLYRQVDLAVHLPWLRILEQLTGG